MKKTTLAAVIVAFICCIPKLRVEAANKETIEAEISEKQQQFEETLQYLDEHYPDRTFGEEIELLKRFSNPASLVDNGAADIMIYSEEDVKSLQNIFDAEIKREPAEEQELFKKAVSANLLRRMQGKTEKEPWFKNYTQRHKDLLAIAMYAEMEEYMYDADAEKVAKAVGSVPLHRMEAGGYYPDDLEEVIWQGYGTSSQQYADRTLNMIRDGVTPPPEFYQWAEELLIDGPIGPENLVFQANFPQGNGTWWQYGKLYFCTADI